MIVYLNGVMPIRVTPILFEFRGGRSVAATAGVSGSTAGKHAGTSVDNRKDER